jgi:hypothetical protein
MKREFGSKLKQFLATRRLKTAEEPQRTLDLALD